MAMDFSTRASAVTHIMLFGLLASGARAEPMLRVPDYVTDHAPMVWLHPEDPYMPSDLLEHIRHTKPMVDGEPVPDLPDLDLDNLGILNEYGDEVALTADESAVLEHPDWLLGEKPDADGRVHNATPCVVILLEKDEVELDAFYFYFYSYDEGPNITQVLKPLDGLVSGERAASGIHFGNHIGDWEHTMVRFRNGKPVGIFYSQHAGGAAYEWNDPTLSITDGRPDVYSARGSHANFPTTGDQIHNVVLVDYCDKGPKWDPVLSAYFYHFDPDAFVLTPLAPPSQVLPSPPPSNQTVPSLQASTNETSWFYFTGRWGDMSYQESDPRQESVPYFGLKRFQSGPTGPRHKPLVRKGLVPDNMRGPSKMERAVALFMALYPFIFKGWRKWVLLGVVIVVTSGIAIGIVYAVRRYRRRRSYRKVQGGDIPMEDWGIGLEEEALLSESDSDSENDDEDKKGRKSHSY